ncbi:hypothetical protein [Actinomadura miaoliensis]
MGPAGLTPAERRVRRAFPEGEMVLGWVPGTTIVAGGTRAVSRR